LDKSIIALLVIVIAWVLWCVIATVLNFYGIGLGIFGGI